MLYNYQIIFGSKQMKIAAKIKIYCFLLKNDQFNHYIFGVFNSRKTCDSCLSDEVGCAWCDQTQSCFVFKTYTSRYPFGQCSHWIGRWVKCKATSIFCLSKVIILVKDAPIKYSNTVEHVSVLNLFSLLLRFFAVES